MFIFSQFRPSPIRKLILIYSECQNKLTGALSKRIQDELRTANMIALQSDKLIDSPQVPFTVVIKDRTLEDGVLELQHQKPRIREEVHVSDLTERILLQTGAITTREATTTRGASRTDSLAASQ